MKNKCLEDDFSKGRPNYLCFQDFENKEIYWFIPISSRVRKFEFIYQQKVEKHKRCNTIQFGEVGGQKRVFLIQNMFPCIEKYVTGQYLIEGKRNAYTLNKNSEAEILKNAREVLKLHKKGVEIIFPNVLKIEKELLEELQKNN
ncbi:MAG: hypothetical protein LBE57_06940 [Methanosarcinales archaeon]|jgi:hypothetical protein|nr:hypothetical protein [Methanosarcinales archaeon]